MLRLLLLQLPLASFVRTAVGVITAIFVNGGGHGVR